MSTIDDVNNMRVAYMLVCKYARPPGLARLYMQVPDAMHVFSFNTLQSRAVRPAIRMQSLEPTTRRSNI